MRLIAVAVLLLAAGCAGPAVGVPATQPVDPLSAEERAFVAEARAAGLAGSDSGAQLVASGRQVCGSALSRAQIVRNAAGRGFPAAGTEAAIDLAVEHLCPGKVFAVDGPVTSFGDGVFLVGAEVVPGRYRTAGAAAARALPNCYWARLRGTSGELRDIIANDNGRGPVTVTISPSDVAFESKGCVGWVKTG